MDRGDWWATVHGVAKSLTQLRDFTSQKRNRLINTENRPEIAKGERGCRREGMEVWD